MSEGRQNKKALEQAIFYELDSQLQAFDDIFGSVGSKICGSEAVDMMEYEWGILNLAYMYIASICKSDIEPFHLSSLASFCTYCNEEGDYDELMEVCYTNNTHSFYGWEYSYVYIEDASSDNDAGIEDARAMYGEWMVQSLRENDCYGEVSIYHNAEWSKALQDDKKRFLFIEKFKKYRRYFGVGYSYEASEIFDDGIFINDSGCYLGISTEYGPLRDLVLTTFLVARALDRYLKEVLNG